MPTFASISIKNVNFVKARNPPASIDRINRARLSTPTNTHRPATSSTNGALISHLTNIAIGIGEEYTAKLDTSAAEHATLTEMLRDTFFPREDDRTGEELEGSDEMQRKDPL